VFLPVRRLVGPIHHRRHALSGEELDEQRRLPPLPPPWSEDDRWYAGGFSPRQWNEIQPLLHGDEYFSDLYDILCSARRRVTICGWCLTPLMPLLRGKGESSSILAHILRDVSREAEVLVLLWSGAPALFEPTTRYVESVRRQLLELAPAVRCELDRRAAFGHDHHQKGVTVDGRIAYVGGMDLTTFQGDRWDTAEHRLRFGPNWHDVQLRLRGEVVRDVEENFCQRWNAVTGESLRPMEVPDADAGLNVPAQVVRTVPAGFYPFAAGGEYGIRHALLAAIKRADRFIYLANQYIWAPDVCDALVDAMNRPRRGPFRIVLVLPAKALEGKYDNDEHVRLLRRADEGRGTFHAYTMYASGPAASRTGYQYMPIYVHAKVAVIDDEWMMVGSANLNRRGLATDTEMNVQAVAPAVARELRVRLWSEHLGMSEDEVSAANPIDLVDREWKDAARDMAARLHAGMPPPGGHLYEYRPDTNPGSRLLDIVQSLTLER